MTDTTTDRRELLKRGGRIALVTPAAMAVLLQAEGRGYALARSGGGSGGGAGGTSPTPPVGSPGWWQQILQNLFPWLFR